MPRCIRSFQNDYVIATGETHSVREFLELAFQHVNLDWQKHVEIDPRYFRPAEVDLLLGDAAKAREKLGWQPSVTFADLTKLMVDADLQAIGLPPAANSTDIATLRQTSKNPTWQ